MGPPVPGWKGPHAAECVAPLPDSVLIWVQSGRLHRLIYTLSRSVENMHVVFCDLMRQKKAVIMTISCFWSRALRLLLLVS